MGITGYRQLSHVVYYPYSPCTILCMMIADIVEPVSAARHLIFIFFMYHILFLSEWGLYIADEA